MGFDRLWGGEKILILIMCWLTDLFSDLHPLLGLQFQILLNSYVQIGTMQA